MDRYEHFTVVGSSALRMVAKTNGIEQAKENADRATEHIGSLTSSSTLGVDKPINSSGLEQFLTARLRVDQRGIYKPHSHVYRCAVRKMNQQVANCMLVAAHGWDIAAAMWAGMRGAFLARRVQPYPLGPQPEIAEPTLTDAAEKLVALPPRPMHRQPPHQTTICVQRRDNEPKTLRHSVNTSKRKRNRSVEGSPSNSERIRFIETQLAIR